LKPVVAGTPTNVQLMVEDSRKEIHMAPTRIVPVAMLVVASGFALQSASAQQQGVKRTELQRYDLSVPGREMIQVRVDLEPGVTFPMHSHPGEEIIYVLEGEWEYQVEGKGAMTLKAGDVLFILAGVKHGAKNVGSGKGSELATYIVEKGKPLVVLAE
jgi:quercetin dioxygenase-like cupin family protein